MNLKTLAVLSDLEDYVYIRALRLPFGFVAVRKSQIFEYIDKIYSDVPMDIKMARENGVCGNDFNGREIYDILSAMERIVENFSIIMYSVVSIKEMKSKLDEIKHSISILSKH